MCMRKYFKKILTVFFFAKYILHNCTLIMENYCVEIWIHRELKSWITRVKILIYRNIYPNQEWYFGQRFFLWKKKNFINLNVVDDHFAATITWQLCSSIDQMRCEQQKNCSRHPKTDVWTKWFQRAQKIDRLRIWEWKWVK